MKRGFTLVELLVAVSVLALLGVFSVWTFERLANTTQSQASVQMIDAELRTLNRKVQQGEISGYEWYISPWDQGMLSNLNSYRVTTPIRVWSFNWKTLSGSLIFTGAALPGYQLYRDETLQATVLSSSLTGIVFQLPEAAHISYSIQWFDGEKQLNTYRFFPLNASGTLDHLRTTITFSGSTATGVILTNIRWQTSLRDSQNNSLNSLDILLNSWDRQSLYTLFPWK